MSEELPVSKTGYSCPNCGAVSNTSTMVSMTEPEFTTGADNNQDPHYTWVETHKCSKCETTYLLNNGT